MVRCARLIPLVIVAAIGAVVAAPASAARTSPQAPSATARGAPDPRGVMLRRTVEGGAYALYLPKTEPVGMLVIVHGTPGAKDVIIELAERFLARWTTFAEENRLVAVAPAFAVDDFGGSDAGLPFGGYRGLIGKRVRADELVHRILDRHDDEVRRFDGRFYLYGHSAGGQFTNRYIVTHPQRIKAAIVSAAGAYAYPDPDRPWPYGMAAVTATVKATGTPVAITPDAAGWLEAAVRPITVIVGEQDSELHETPFGKLSRIDQAKRWVDAMNAHAARARREGAVRLVTVPGTGHSSAQLTAPTQNAFTRAGLRVPTPQGGGQ